MSQNQDLIFAITRLTRMLRRHPVEQDGLSHASHHILRIVQENDGIRAAELAQLMAVRPASMTQALNRLEQEGYISRKRDESDSRAKRVFVTEKARAQYQEHIRSRQADNDRLLACLTAEETEAFLAICDKLCAVLEADRAGGQDHEIKEEPHG
jgi:DNA-binding MarR family transcriptional regulator